MAPSSSSRRDQGFTLAEVIVAGAILTLGMLGIAAMQGTAIRGGSDSKARQTAVAVADGLMEQISQEARMVALDKYAYPTTTTALSTNTVFQQTYTTANPAVAPGPASVSYATTAWSLSYDANGITPVPAGSSTYYTVAINRVAPTLLTSGVTQSVSFSVTVGWTESGYTGAAAKTLVVNRYVMY
jgi:type IV pilus modification protein PilV